MTPYLFDRITLCRQLLTADPDNLVIGQLPEGTLKVPTFVDDYPLYRDFLHVTNGPLFDVTVLLSAEELAPEHDGNATPLPDTDEGWLCIGSAFYIPIAIEMSTQRLHVYGANAGIHQEYDSFDTFAEQLFDGRYLDVVVVENDQWSDFLERNGLV